MTIAVYASGAHPASFPQMWTKTALAHVMGPPLSTFAARAQAAKLASLQGICKIAMAIVEATHLWTDVVFAQAEIRVLFPSRMPTARVCATARLTMIPVVCV